MNARFPLKAIALTVAMQALPQASHAAEQFKVRFPLSGTLGGEIVAASESTGWFGSFAVTQLSLDKVTDGSGNARRESVDLVLQQTGTVIPNPTLPNGQPRQTITGGYDFNFKQDQTITSLIVGYLTDPAFGGGRLSFVANLPYTARLKRDLTLGTSSINVATNPALPPQQAALVKGQVTAALQKVAVGVGDEASVTLDGLGDAEVSALWIRREGNVRVAAGLTLAMPTGSYDADRYTNIGFGNFYTLRPGVAVSWSPSDTWTLGARTSLGFNTRNDDTQVRTGNYAALDLAAVYRTPWGVFGPHLLHVQQFQDDSGGNLGGNRFSSTGGGAFFTTFLKPIETAITLSYMTTMTSENALSGSYFQLRVSKAF